MLFRSSWGDRPSQVSSDFRLLLVNSRPQLLLQGRLRPNSYGSRVPSTTSAARKTPPGLLQEPDSVHNFCSKEDSARTPTGARLRPQLLQQGRLRPDSYGSRTPSIISAARKTLPGLLREPDSIHHFCGKEDFARTPTGAGLRPRLLPLVSLVQTPTGAGLRF